MTHQNESPDWKCNAEQWPPLNGQNGQSVQNEAERTVYWSALAIMAIVVVVCAACAGIGFIIDVCWPCAIDSPVCAAVSIDDDHRTDGCLIVLHCLSVAAHCGLTHIAHTTDRVAMLTSI